MFDRMAFAVYSAYFKAKNKITNLSKEEDGMETLETVILIAIAVVIAGVIVNFLTGGADGEGLIKQIFTKIANTISSIFSDNKTKGQGGGITVS